MIAQGTEGAIEIVGLHAGTLVRWHVAVSPTTTRTDAKTGQPVLADDGRPIPALTLFGEGHFLRFFLGGVGGPVAARLTPVAAPAYIGRKKPPTPKPFLFTGILFSLTPTHIVISAGEIPGWMPPARG